MGVMFYELAVGARFVFRGRRFEKVAVCMAEDEGRLGNIFLGGTEVEVEQKLKSGKLKAERGQRGEGRAEDGLLLPPAEAARWKPDDRYWADHLAPAPGQKGQTLKPETLKPEIAAPDTKDEV